MFTCLSSGLVWNWEGHWSWGRPDLLHTQFWSAFSFNNLANEAENAVTKFVKTQNEEEGGNVTLKDCIRTEAKLEIK